MWKKIFFLSFIVSFLAACADSRSVNEEAASAYRETINQAQQKGAVDTQSSTAKRIKRIFTQMVPIANAENQTGEKFDWQISVIKSRDLNAWAMPGGKMAFYTGLVETLKLTNDEIASVMGHEMAHALKEHGKKRMNVEIAGNIVGTVAGKALEIFVGSDASSAIVDLAKDWGLSKPYSRSNETEADEVGLMLMAKSGFNPEAAPKVWEKMQKISNNSNKSKGILVALSSTHPSDADRQQNLLRLMPQALQLYRKAKRR